MMFNDDEDTQDLSLDAIEEQLSKEHQHKKKRKKAEIIILILAISLILFGCGTLLKIYLDNKSMADQAYDDVKNFENHITETAQPSQQPDSAEDQNETLQLSNGAIGALYIPSFDNFQHLIAYGVDRSTLNWYVGMYKSYSPIGKNGTCILASHSNKLPGKQAYCYFNRIEDYVKIGDKVNVLWHDGNTYHYKIIEINTWIPKENKEDYMEETNDGRQYLILQTCTYGDGRYRTFIKCVRTDSY